MKKISKSLKRKKRVRKKLRSLGGQKLRISIFKSLKNLSAQVIDDKTMKTLVSISSTEKNFKASKSKKELPNILGEELAKRVKAKKIDSDIYFDRGSYKYHGKIKLFADSLRKNGVKF